MTARVELTSPGDSLTMIVRACGKANVGKYPGIEFTGDDGKRSVTVEVPETSVQRQFARLGVTYQSVIGEVLTISRSLKTTSSGAPFWNLEIAGQVAPSATIAPAPKAQEIPLPTPPEDAVVTAPAAVDHLVASFALYDKCFSHAVVVARRAVEIGFPVDAAAIAATLYIQANKR